MNTCPHCGMFHQMTCPRIKAIEYHPDGITLKRVEFHPPLPIALGTAISPNISNTIGIKWDDGIVYDPAGRPRA